MKNIAKTFKKVTVHYKIGAEWEVSEEIAAQVIFQAGSVYKIKIRNNGAQYEVPN